MKTRTLVTVGFLVFALIALMLPSLFIRESSYEGSSDLHAIMEMLGSIFGLVAGFAFVLRYYAIGNQLMLFVGLAFIVNGAEDFAHGVLAFRYTALFTGVDQDVLRKFIPGTYVAGRILLGVMMLGAPALSLRTPVLKFEDRARITWIYSLIAAGLAIAGTAIAFALPLPHFIYPEHVISRPVDLLSAGIIGAAMIVFLRRYLATRDQLTLLIATSLAVNVAGQVIMARSEVLFDGAFDLSHVYKIVGYLIPLIGFAIFQINDLRAAEIKSNGLWKVLDQHTLLSLIDSDGKVAYANNGFCKLGGYRTDEILGEPLPLWKEDVWPQVSEYLNSGQTWRGEVELKNGDGEPLWVDARFVPQVDSAGRLMHAISLKFDVDEKKRLEQQLSQSQKLESIGQLSAGIAHEINTPMQFVSHNLQFLSKSSDKLFAVVDRYQELLFSDDQKCRQQRKNEIEGLQKQSRFDYVRDQFPKAIEECRGGIDRVIDIVNAMKDFSHPGTREKLSMNLNKAIESTIAISRSRWKHAADLELDLDPELPSIDGYSSELNQVLLNLVVNAGDAIAEKVNEGEIGKIIVRSRHDSRSVSIIVEDNGGGIPESIRQKIFDPFFTTKEVGKGTGQGLAITHNVVVNMHGGAIDIDSHEGVGTAFTIQLPREAGLEQPSSNDNARVEPSDQMLMAT